jgi:hypothetical protein
VFILLEIMKVRPQIVYEPTVFAGETLREHWPELHKVVANGDQLAAAFHALSKDPAWRNDPRLRDIDPETATEVLDLYNEVIVDGRHVKEFLTEPTEVLSKLKLRASKEAIAVIKAAGGDKSSDVGVVGAAVVISISVVAAAVTTAIVSSHADRRDRILIDESGRVKLGAAKAKRKQVG